MDRLAHEIHVKRYMNVVHQFEVLCKKHSLKYLVFDNLKDFKEENGVNITHVVCNIENEKYHLEVIFGLEESVGDEAPDINLELFVWNIVKKEEEEPPVDLLQLMFISTNEEICRFLIEVKGRILLLSENINLETGE